MCNAKIKYIEDKTPNIAILAANTTQEYYLILLTLLLLLLVLLLKIKHQTIVNVSLLKNFNRLTVKKFSLKLAQANFVSQNDFVKKIFMIR